MMPTKTATTTSTQARTTTRKGDVIGRRRASTRTEPGSSNVHGKNPRAMATTPSSRGLDGRAISFATVGADAVHVPVEVDRRQRGRAEPDQRQDDHAGETQRQLVNPSGVEPAGHQREAPDRQREHPGGPLVRTPS